MAEQPVIFVVDDDLELCQWLSLSLRHLECEVVCFSSAEDFLAQANLDQPSCLVLDVKLPGMTGLQLQELLLQRGSRVPIVFISGHGEIAMAATACRRGAIDFLEKPFTLSRLTTRINEALEKDKVWREQDAELRTLEARFNTLTEREVEVMTMVVAGAATATSREIAHKLGISFRTVETYRGRLMVKMHARSIANLMHMARLCGIYRPES